jgi:hypothetical protein
MGASETSLAPTREETSSLRTSQTPQIRSGRSDTRMSPATRASSIAAAPSASSPPASCKRGSPMTFDHQFLRGKLAKVIVGAEPILRSDDLQVEIEYEDCRPRLAKTTASSAPAPAPPATSIRSPSAPHGRDGPRPLRPPLQTPRGIAQYPREDCDHGLRKRRSGLLAFSRPGQSLPLWLRRSGVRRRPEEEQIAVASSRANAAGRKDEAKALLARPAPWRRRQRRPPQDGPRSLRLRARPKAAERSRSLCERGTVGRIRRARLAPAAALVAQSCGWSASRAKP